MALDPSLTSRLHAIADRGTGPETKAEGALMDALARLPLSIAERSLLDQSRKIRDAPVFGLAGLAEATRRTKTKEGR